MSSKLLKENVDINIKRGKTYAKLLFPWVEEEEGGG